MQPAAGYRERDLYLACEEQGKVLPAEEVARSLGEGQSAGTVSRIAQEVQK